MAQKKPTVYEFIPKLGQLRDDVLFGDVWEHPDLSKRDRSLITVAMLAALLPGSPDTRITNRFGGVAVIPAAERGIPVDLLAGRGKRLGADLIAVARRSRSALESLLVGSVARRIVAEADRDVLVLRAPSPA